MLHYYVFPVSDEMLIPNTTIPSVHLTYLVWNVRIHTRLASHAMHRSRRCQINVPTKGPMEVTVKVAALLLGSKVTVPKMMACRATVGYSATESGKASMAECACTAGQDTAPAVVYD